MTPCTNSFHLLYIPHESTFLKTLEIRLNFIIVELASNKTFCWETLCIQILILNENMEIQINVRVYGDMVLGDNANRAFVVREQDLGRSSEKEVEIQVDAYEQVVPSALVDMMMNLEMD